MGIGETLFRYLAKLVIREAGDQEKTACGNHQLCAGLEASIEGATHAVGQRRLERVRRRRQEGKEAETLDEEEESDRMAAGLNNLTKETAGTEEDVAECLGAALEMEVNGEDEGKGEEGGNGTLRAVRAQ